MGPACSAGDPFLVASGLEIRDGRGNGDVVSLRGGNLGGWLMLEPWMSPFVDAPDDFTVRQTLTSRFGAAASDALIAAFEGAWMQSGDFDNMAALGMSAVRVPFEYANLENPDGSLRVDAFARLDWAVTEAWKRCIYTILDLHGAPGSQNGWESSGMVGPAALWTSPTDQQHTIAIWQEVAAHYRGNPAVAGYDLLNEPAGASTDQDRWALQDRIYRAVRAVDPEHMVFIEAIWWLDNLPPPAMYGWNNVVYECHHYEWSVQTDDQKQRDGADAKVADFLSHATYGVPFFLGEFNFFANPDAWSYGIEQWDRNGISWTTWSWRADVPGAGVEDSWGVYNPRDPGPPAPSVASDPQSTILADWSRWDASAFGINPMLQTALGMPTAVFDQYRTASGIALDVPAPGVLTNDRDANLGAPGIALVARQATGPAHGTLTMNADGSFRYAPASGFRGTDSFRYSAFDGRVDSARLGVVTIAVN
jgi:aryl-phospho-beta-D-glucosidase BglC (GH1 family)